MTDSREPETSPLVRRLIDLAVFAPLGAALTWREQLPVLVREGRQRVDQQVVLARFVGKLAVQQGRVELRKRLEARRATVRESPSPAEPSVIAAAEVAPSPGSEEATAPAVTDLAIAEFDSLAATQVIDRLAALTPEELDLVERYERAHRRRRTVLGRIQQLRGTT